MIKGIAIDIFVMILLLILGYIEKDSCYTLLAIGIFVGLAFFLAGVCSEGCER